MSENSKFNEELARKFAAMKPAPLPTKLTRADKDNVSRGLNPVRISPSIQDSHLPKNDGTGIEPKTYSQSPTSNEVKQQPRPEAPFRLSNLWKRRGIKARED